MSDQRPWEQVDPETLGFLPGDQRATPDSDAVPVTSSEQSLDDIFATPPPPAPHPFDPPTPTPPAFAPPSGSPLDAPPATRTQRRAESIEAMRAAASVMTKEEMDLAGARAQFERRLANLENFYVYVDPILEFIGTHVELRKIIGAFELTNDPTQDARQRRAFEDAVRPMLAESSVQIGIPKDVPTVFDLAYDEIIGISIMGDLWRDPTVDEILVDAWNKISIERYGVLQDTGYRFRSPEHAGKVARQLSEMVSDRVVSTANPIPTAILPAARVQFAYGDVVRGGLAITIRRFKKLLGMTELLEFGSLSPEFADFLAACVQARATILVAGGVGTGKTTMINALSEFIPDTERVITIEDAFELQLSNHHVVSLQARTRARLEDTQAVSQEDLLIATLRMRPDRIVVGEVREPQAAATMIQAANTGHDGTMTTIHASSTSAALNSRMTSLLMRSGSGFSESVAHLEVATAFDLVIQINKFRGRRYVYDIALVDAERVSTRVEPLTLFTGRPAHDGTITFAPANSLPLESELYQKLFDTGIDPARWSRP